MSANDIVLIQENASSDFVQRVLTSIAAGKALVINGSNLPEFRALAISDIASLQATLDAKIASTEKGIANGIATLGSDGKVPTAQLPGSIAGAVSYQGSWNANTNTPTMATASGSNKGFYFVVSVAGATNINGITDWKIGDWIISNGTTWEKVDNTDSVTSVAGKIGDVTLTSADVGLGNLVNALQLLASNLDIDGTLTANSDTKIPSQKAVKTYADTKAPIIHDHNANYEPKNSNIQTHIADTVSHVTSGDKNVWNAKLGWVTAPATNSSSGVAGQIAYDNDYLYICVATNTWKRFPLLLW